MFDTKLELLNTFFSRRRVKRFLFSNDGKALLFIALIVFCFFISKWTLQGAWFPDDLADFFSTTTPIEDLYSRIQRSGESPLWAPELAGGYPLLATGQLGFWYPPHVLLRQFLPGVWTLNLSLLLHSLLAAIGTFIFLRLNKIGALASVFGAILLSLGSAFVGKYILINIILPFTWVPILLIFLQLFLTRGRLAFLFWWIVVSIFSVLVGHPQMTVLIFMLEAVFVVCVVLVDWRRWLRALSVLGAVFLVVGITMPMLLPILDVVPLTDRANGISTDKELFEFSHSFSSLKGLVVPHPFGHAGAYNGPKNEAELSIYLGPLAVLLALTGLLVGIKRHSILWVFSLASISAGVLLAFGGGSPFYRWLVDNGWRYFNIPARFFLFAHIGLVLLAVAGLNFIGNRISHKYLRLIAITLLLIGSLVPALWVSWDWYEGTPWKFTKEPAAAKVLKRQDSSVRVFSKEQLSDNTPHNDFRIMVWDPICSDCLYRQEFVSPFKIINGINLKSSRAFEAGRITIKLFDDKGVQLRESSIQANEIIDSEWNKFSFPPLEDVFNKQMYFEVTSDIERGKAPRLYIHANTEDGQYNPTGTLFNCSSGVCEVLNADSQSTDAAFELTTPKSEALIGYELLIPHIPGAFGIGSAQWIGPLGILDVTNYLKPLGEDATASTWQENRFLVNRFPITHAIGLFPSHRYATNLVDFTEITSIPIGNEFIRIYRNNQAFPRLHFANNVKAVSGSLEQRDALSKIDPQDENTVVADIENNAEFAPGGVAKIVKDDRSRITVRTNNQSSGFLVMRDTLLPGWVATIDDTTVPIHLTDSLFRGVQVPAGEHEIVFEYKPDWIKTSVIISVTAFVIVILLVYMSFKRAIVPEK